MSYETLEQGQYWSEFAMKHSKQFCHEASQPMLAAVLGYLERGWEVFPVPPGTKMGYSIKQRGFDNGKPWGKTKNEAEVREYWRRLPRANIGVPMGIASGIFDIEVDTREGHSKLEQDGAVSLAALEEKHGALPPTLMFVSPSGSVHRLFKHPGGDFRVEHSTSKLGAGIDVIGDGFMSVVPPSIKPGKGAYRWINDLPVATAPDWLLELVRKDQSEPRNFDREPEADIAQLTLAMAMIPNADLSWEEWNRVGMALFAATGGSVEGFGLFDAWSQRSSKYDAAVTQDKWEKKFGSCPPRKIGAGTIFHKAEMAVPGWEVRLYFNDKKIEALLAEFYVLLGEPS
jgi:bifunctional DNA primase/polymerase-like protein/primase-like protein